MRSKYRAEANKRLDVVDWRDPARRKDRLGRFLQWRVRADEMDDHCWNFCFVKDMSLEEKLWYGILYGFSYDPLAARSISWHYPTLASVNMDDFERLMKESGIKNIMKSHARYFKIRTMDCIAEVKKWVGEHGTIVNKVASLYDADPVKHFHNIWRSMSGIKGFGRFSLWNCLQCWQESCGVQMEPDTMFISNDSSAMFQWAGLCQYDDLPEYLYDHMSCFSAKPRLHTPVTKETIQWFEKRSKEILKEIQRDYPESHMTMFRLESMFCEWSYDMDVIHPGDHSIKIMGSVPKYRNLFPKVDYSPIERVIDKMPSVIAGFESVFPGVYTMGTSGQFLFIHEFFPDMPDMFEELGLTPDFFKMRQLDNGQYVSQGNVAERKQVLHDKIKEYAQWWNSKSNALF